MTTMNPRIRTSRSKRRARGGAMVETVLVLPFIFVILVLLVYLGWNFRRMAQVTNMDRYVLWEHATPGAPGPDMDDQPPSVRKPRLEDAFYGLNGDLPESLTTRSDRNEGRSYLPISYEALRDEQADEDYSYISDFLDRQPRAIRERFEARHDHLAEKLENLEMSDRTKNAQGHSRLNGDWRYANGVRFNGEYQEWEAGGYRVVPGPSLREVFYVELDDGLESYENNNNNLARAIRDFYARYPGYHGPRVDFGED